MPPGHSSLSFPNFFLRGTASISNQKMHLITPLLLLSGLGSALASPLLLPPNPRPIPVDSYPMSAEEYVEKNRKLNATCEANASDLIEQLVFKHCKSPPSSHSPFRSVR
jgi:hypothetical protein